MLGYGIAGSGKGERSVGGAALAVFACALAQPALAGTTPAGTRIVNTASLTHGIGGTRETVASNSVALRIDAAIDVAIAARVPALTVEAGAAPVIVAFVVTNLGNARETFALSGAAADRAVAVAVDRDGDGAYDAVRDAGARVALEPGETRTVFAIVPGPVTAATRVTMTATATTGRGQPGTTIPGAGPDGSDAVVGATGGTASAETLLTTGADLPSLAKSQSIVAPDGSARVMPGSTVTYRLDARFPAATAGAVVDDVLPAGTRFVPGSITLDDRAQTDADDGDATRFDGTAVRVRLGDMPAGAVRTIRFQTIIE